MDLIHLPSYVRAHTVSACVLLHAPAGGSARRKCVEVACMTLELSKTALDCHALSRTSPLPSSHTAVIDFQLRCSFRSSFSVDVVPRCRSALCALRSHQFMEQRVQGDVTEDQLPRCVEA